MDMDPKDIRSKYPVMFPEALIGARLGGLGARLGSLGAPTFENLVSGNHCTDARFDPIIKVADTCKNVRQKWICFFAGSAA